MDLEYVSAENCN